MTRVMKPDGGKSPRAVSLALQPGGEGVAAVEDGGALGLYDAEGDRTGEAALPSGAAQALRMGEAWLVRVQGATHLAPSNAKLVKGKPAVFAEGGAGIEAFAVAVDGVAVARSDSLELWTHAGKLRWAVPGAWVAAAIVPGHVVALAADGTLAFAAMRDGQTVGTVHLASTEAASEWRLACVDVGRVVLALGDWLVWIDVATRKTLRRVRARDKVTALVADAQWVVCATDSGWVQAFAADSGEPGAAFDAEQGKLTSLALGKKTAFSGGQEPPVRAWPRSQLDVARSATSPVTALAARGDLTAVGDGAGRVRLLRAGAELMTRRLGEAVTSTYVARGDVLLAVTARLVLRMDPPWNTPRPLSLRSPASAFAADEDYAFAGTELGSVDVYDLATAAHVTSYALSDGEVTALARLPGRFLVVGTGALDGRVFVVDVTEPRVLHRLEPHDEAFAVTCLACGPQGRIVASGADDGSIALIDPAKGKILARLRVRETPVSIAFDADGRCLACVFADGTACLVKLGPRGATIEDIALVGATRVSWGDDPVFGFADGRVERLAGSAKGEAARARV